MIRKSLRACAFVGAVAVAVVSLGQDAKPLQVEPAKDAAPAGAGGAGGGIFGEFNMGLPDEAIGLIAKQAGVELVVPGNAIWTNAEPITLKVDDGYFWPTFMEMCKQAKISYMPEPGPAGRNKVRLMDVRGGGDPFAEVPRSVSKGFVVLAQSATRTYSVFYGKAAVPPRDTLRLQMQVLIDPVTPVTSWDLPTVTEAVDENGASLVPQNSKGVTFLGGAAGGLLQPVTIDLAENASVGKKIATLKGTLNGTAVVKSEKLDLDLPLPPEGKTVKAPDYDVVLASPKGGAAFVLNVRFISHQADAAPVTPGGKGAPRRGAQMQTQMNLLNSLSVLDAQGNQLISRPSLSLDPQGNAVANIAIMSAKGGGEPAKISWKVPVATKPIQIPFEFKDLAIP